MFTIGDKVFYGAHGVCVIQDIQELSFSGQQKHYYVLHSYHDASIKLYHPVETEDSKLAPITSKKEAEGILEIFKNPPDVWQERMVDRSQHYQNILESKDHVQIAQMMNTILRKKNELEQDNKKLTNHDTQILKQVSPIFYEELAISLELSVEEVMKRVEETIQN
ncbi:CarD family transcriptional regulator [Ureibacillus sp. 179-F W5.1 NHS]|nr:CarD family transcriptional regulator [Lysinibacillus halotolerans]